MKHQEAPRNANQGQVPHDQLLMLSLFRFSLLKRKKKKNPWDAKEKGSAFCFSYCKTRVSMTSFEAVVLGHKMQRLI